MMFVKIDAQVEWKAFRDKSSDMWVGVCEPLRLTVEGESWSDLQRAINETLEGVFEMLVEEKELDSFLKSHGWRLLSKIPVDQTPFRFDIPFTVQRESHNNFAHV